MRAMSIKLLARSCGTYLQIYHGFFYIGIKLQLKNLDYSLYFIRYQFKHPAVLRKAIDVFNFKIGTALFFSMYCIEIKCTWTMENVEKW